MEKKPFFTELFYNDSSETVRVLNDLLDADLIIENETYSSGALLSVEVIDGPVSRGILSKLICDIDAYCKENNECYTSSEIDISINLLSDEYSTVFKDSLMWDNETEVFY